MMKNDAVLIWMLIASELLLVASLSPLVPPKLIPITRSTQLRKGERYQLVCSTSDGSPPLSFKWSRNGEAVVDGSEISVRKLDEFSSALVIERVQEQHAGNYSCTVSNPSGSHSGITVLQVLYPPSWVRVPTDISVVSGTKISLSCEAAGSPRPVITWRRNTGFSAADFQPIQTDARLRISDDGQINIPEARKGDEGFYECLISNGIGEQLKKTIRIEVQVPPKVSPGQSTLRIEKGKDVAIQCNMTGDSPLTVMWEKNGKVLETRKEKMQIEELPTDVGVTSSLLITNLDRDSSGLYICKVKNTYGESYRIIALEVVEHPSAPSDVTVSQVWSRSVHLTWSSPYSGNRPITSYTIQYWKTEGKSAPPPDKPQEVMIPSLQTSAVVQKLLPNTLYSLLVIAENEVGLSAPSITVTVTTREEEPDWSPAEITVQDQQATSVKLKWKCPENREWFASLKGYYVGYKRMSSRSPYTFRTLAATECSKHQEFVLAGLERASSYAVIVKAYNHVGVGPPSEQIIIHTSDGGPPRTPHVKLLRTGGVTCHLKIWPRENSRNLPSEFALHVKDGSMKHKLFVSVIPSQNYSIGGLIPGAHYEIYVTAKNRFGESAPSETIKIVTDRNDPSLIELPTEPVYHQLSFIVPIVISAIVVVLLPLSICFCMKKSSGATGQSDGVETRDFLYTTSTIQRVEGTLRRTSDGTLRRPSDGTLRRPSGTLPRPVPTRLSSLPRPPRNRPAPTPTTEAATTATTATTPTTTTTTTTPIAATATVPRAPPMVQTSYSTLQNYGTVTEDDSRYDSVVEEMRTFINAGATRPKKAIVEEIKEDS